VNEWNRGAYTFKLENSKTTSNLEGYPAALILIVSSTPQALSCCTARTGSNLPPKLIYLLILSDSYLTIKQIVTNFLHFTQLSHFVNYTNYNNSNLDIIAIIVCITNVCVITVVLLLERLYIDRLVVQCGLDKQHANCRLAALAAVSRDAVFAPKLSNDFYSAKAVSDCRQIILCWAGYPVLRTISIIISIIVVSVPPTPPPQPPPAESLIYY